MPNSLYPKFGSTPFHGRVQRLEKGSQRQQRGQLRPMAPTGNTTQKRHGLGGYTRLPVDALVQSGPLTTQRINLAHTNIHKVGSTPPNSVSGNFGYNAPAAGTSIQWFWDSTNGSSPIVLHRSDGSHFTLPTSSITVAGLTASTTYYFLPFWNVNAKTVGWVKGTVGNPQIAFVVGDTTGTLANFYIISQNQQNLEPLSGGFMSATTGTGSVGGGGGAGGGGGNGHCVMSGTEIETLGELPYVVKSYDEYTWLHIVDEDDNWLNCTVDHPLYHASEGRVTASDLAEGDIVITKRGERQIIEIKTLHKKYLKNEIHMEKGHLYWANGFLSHNVKIP